MPGYNNIKNSATATASHMDKLFPFSWDVSRLIKDKQTKKQIYVDLYTYVYTYK